MAYGLDEFRYKQTLLYDLSHVAYGPDEFLYKQMLLYDLSHVAYGPDEFLYKQMLLYDLSHVDVVVPMSSFISRCYCTTCLM